MNILRDRKMRQIVLQAGEYFSPKELSRTIKITEIVATQLTSLEGLLSKLDLGTYDCNMLT